ncbi:MAG: copper resistance protein CopD [Xanthomonadales bacterium]|nr:copper resistance protein CopD [Xanthomonadales bacterium]NIN60271.1 copper resistance protein CopD [Xanthomonadales bacterium]NIN75623.1 copper resistance protein CopD [Xanthomonadales bacterium]NIO14696.1 copper resistance protein CopD [Xanthomonadales bacterium]NIP12664.1 copper resistance protein CopD [Xanthomonadales bacterium]
MYAIALTLHALAATVWTGGHLVLVSVVLPDVLRGRDVARLRQFEAGYERIGMPALIVQVATGAWLAHQRVPGVANWFDLSNPVARLIAIKLALLLITVALAAHARLRLLPALSERQLGALAWHIVAVTLASVGFVVVGVAFRTGGLG